MPILAVASLVLSVALDQAPPQRPRPAPRQPPPPAGQRIMVGDGDLVVANHGARVRLVRRTDANVRAIYNAAERWLVLLVDETGADGRAPDGGVDATYTFNDVAGEWPFGERWEGAATMEEYTLLGGIPAGPPGVGLVTPSGLIQLFARNADAAFRDASATSLAYAGFGRGGGGNQAFAAVEAQQIGVATRNARGRGPGGGFSSSVGVAMAPVEGGVTFQPAPGAGTAPGASPPPSAPVRVGGNIKTPQRLVHVPPVTPPEAVQAGIRGVVIVEIVIAPDGAVRDATILRSIPLLDRAAIDAVAKWRYEPTLLNGVPVPVIMTVTVNF